MAVRDRIEDHRVENDLIKDSQSGFTPKGRMENNLMILKHCIDNTFRDKLPLYVTSIDFAKAYDSLKRENILEVLKKYEIHANTIEIIKKIYTGDWTNILVNDEKIKMEVSSGIRQGCTASTTLFKLITYKIMQGLEDLNKGFKDDKFNLTCWFTHISITKIHQRY